MAGCCQEGALLASNISSALEQLGMPCELGECNPKYSPCDQDAWSSCSLITRNGVPIHAVGVTVGSNFSESNGQQLLVTHSLCMGYSRCCAEQAIEAMHFAARAEAQMQWTLQVPECKMNRIPPSCNLQGLEACM
eukprot:3509683-Rhodomonas_salina.1